MREGSTTVVKDLLERLPLPGFSLGNLNNKNAAIRLFSLEDCERGLDLIVLVVFVLDIVIYAGNLLRSASLADNRSYPSGNSDFLKHIYELAERLVRPVFDFVPMKGFKILVHWLCSGSADLYSCDHVPNPTDCH